MFLNKIALADALLLGMAEHSKNIAERGDGMFRAELKQLANGSILKMEGRLVGPWAKEARSLVTGSSVLEGLIVDLTEVSYVDGIGEQLLTWLSSIGALFVAKAVYGAAICERLGLPFHQACYQGQLAAQDDAH